METILIFTSLALLAIGAILHRIAVGTKKQETYKLASWILWVTGTFVVIAYIAYPILDGAIREWYELLPTDTISILCWIVRLWLLIGSIFHWIVVFKKSSYKLASWILGIVASIVLLILLWDYIG